MEILPPMTNKTKKQAAPLSKNATKYLRGVAHHISPLVTIADKGVTENILTELDICLERHELVKVKIRADRETRKAMAEELIKSSNAQEVQSIGQVLTLYRANPKDGVYELPK
ncbi:ribosome assembly RNA-binding protein YhbY [Marinicella rhabdoformis]|uniref:ribosome assembly RNA-binding protein YhbY n=1 Tax=Marinicella rhabdoformis TaxID=2580566 RepID=UPI0012AED8EA|nr:ribosome assembly RNA-binding protein YhbY [Marinicella rhabdoformis]